MPANTVTSATPNGNGPNAVEHPAPARGRVPLRLLWFGLAGAPLAWSAQLLAAFPLSAHACFPRLWPLTEPDIGPTTLSSLLIALSIVTTAVSIFALVTAIRSWRATLDESRGDAHHALDVGNGRTRFMALGGILMSTIFLVATVAQGALVLLVQPCAQVAMR